MTTNRFRPAAVIPTFNHHLALPEMLHHLTALALPVWIIDDGSDEPARSAIAQLSDSHRNITVYRLPCNQGKGVAVCQGFRLANQAGYSHVLQVDADGQHELQAVARLLSHARQFPHALISGKPVYDSSAPWGRILGRWITHLWVFLETLSFRIHDSMCGLRVYPLEPVIALMEKETPGKRMDFDTDIIVRLFWRGVPPLMVPVAVRYPAENHSNFRLWRDNLAISRMHARLILILLRTLPAILAHRPPALPALHNHPAHWSELAERGTLLGMQIAVVFLGLFGRTISLVLLAPVIGYFFLTGSKQRHAALNFLQRVANRSGQQHKRLWWQGLRLYFEFSRRMIDLFLAWSGRISPQALRTEHPHLLAALTENSSGGLLVVSHHGNVELSRAFLPPALRQRLTLLIHTQHAERFNHLLARLYPAARANTVQVTELSVSTAIALRERIERGEWLAIAGDRVPVSQPQQRVTSVPFLGSAAPFPQGPWLLANMMECPVHLLFCRRERQHWHLMIEPFAERIVLPRGTRQATLDQLVARYAHRLEQECLTSPTQWGNFYDFWPYEKKAP
ncbi:MAG: glycosyltransferase family 2 protein [Magnetococcales bacterium]|nr:glycosyltransferase family 2 protein [Magnetococcales bacterium]MBF0114074.1 glycosyltransferase family 2 protein [Magnetococcales bacterium]